jgi:hypothetical protein
VWVSGEPDAEQMVEETCYYVMVFAVDKPDGRNLREWESELAPFAAVLMGETRCRGRVRSDPLDTPFRDGCHIKWDAKRFGWPAFVSRGSFLRHLEDVR